MLRAKVVASYALVLVLAAELAVWGSFLVAARPWDRGVPLAALVAGAANVCLGRAGARVLGRRAGAVPPGLIWLVVALTLSGSRAEGDVVVPATTRGWAFLLVGMVSAAVVATTARATPLGQDGR